MLKMGFPKKKKLEKPSFKPIIPKNTEKESLYAAKIKNMDEKKLSLKFLDFDKDVEHREVSNKVNLYKDIVAMEALQHFPDALLLVE